MVGLSLLSRRAPKPGNTPDRVKPTQHASATVPEDGEPSGTGEDNAHGPALGAEQHPRGTRRRRNARDRARYGRLSEQVRNVERQPYIVAMRSYLDDIRTTLGTSTYKERESKLVYLFEVMLELGLNTNPAELDKDDINALTDWMRRRNLALSYQSKLWLHLKGLLGYVGNHILDDMRRRGQWRPPKRIYRKTKVKSKDEVVRILNRLSQLPGWRAAMVTGATAMYFATGVRPKELRLAGIDDLDMTRWVLTVEHPKGENSWAVGGEEVRIFEDFRQYVLDYLSAREAHLRQLGLDPEQVKPLFPNENGSCYSADGWRTARWKLCNDLGIDDMPYKALRPSFGQHLKNNGAPIEAVSKALRHQTVATTEQFYARIQTEQAWDTLEQYWQAPEFDMVEVRKKRNGSPKP